MKNSQSKWQTSHLLFIWKWTSKECSRDRGHHTKMNYQPEISSLFSQFSQNQNHNFLCTMFICIQILSPLVALVGKIPIWPLLSSLPHPTCSRCPGPGLWVGLTVISSHEKLRFSCSCRSERCQPLVATLKDDPWLYTQMDVPGHSSVDKAEWWRKDSYWKWIYEKSPILCMIMEEKTISMLIKEWWTQVETKLIR